MTLATIKALLAQLIAAIAELEAGGPVEPQPVENEAPFGRNLAGQPNFAPAYDACRGLWEAAQRAGAFSIWVYIGPGIQSYAGQLASSPKPNLRALEDAIVALGFAPWGQAWLAHPENRALVDPGYVRRFGFKPVTRERDGSLREYD